jgi:hypothetical protein
MYVMSSAIEIEKSDKAGKRTKTPESRRPFELLESAAHSAPPHRCRNLIDLPSC